MTHDLSSLPPEILLRILSYLPIPDLLQISRTCHNLHTLACDPFLHTQRLREASALLASALQHRPRKNDISPPNSWIWLSKTNVLSRSISKSLIRIRLNHNLEHRPRAQELVARAILHSSCTSYSSAVSPALIQKQEAVQRLRLKDGLARKLERRPSVTSLVSWNILPEECAGRHAVSPALVATRRRVMKESLKDGLRAWVEGRAVAAQKRKADEIEAVEKNTVKGLVKRFTAKKPEYGHDVDTVDAEKKKAQARWGREVAMARRRQESRASTDGACAQPTRANVLGLKRFWEGVIRAAAV